MNRAYIAETLSESIGYLETPERHCTCRDSPLCSDCREHFHARELHGQMRNIISFLAHCDTAEAWATVIEGFASYNLILKALADGKDDRLHDVLGEIDDPAERAKDLEEALETLGKASL